MDISNFDRESIEYGNMLYYSIKEECGITEDNLESCSDRQRKALRWHLLEERNFDSDLPDEIAYYFNKCSSDKQRLECIFACHKEMQKIEENQRLIIENAVADLPEDVQNAFYRLIGDCSTLPIVSSGSDALLIINNVGGIECKLILQNAENLPEQNYDFAEFTGEFIEKNSDGYTLKFSAHAFDDDDNETSLPCAVHFKGTVLQTDVYKAEVSYPRGVTPWLHLYSLAVCIINKAELSESLLNAQEKALLPLSYELANLLERNSIESVLNDPPPFEGFPNLKKMVTDYHFDDLLPMILNLENVFYTEKRAKTAIRLHKQLNLKRYEPLFQAINGAFLRAQAEYQTKADHCVPQDTLLKVRRSVTDYFAAVGYSGQYPDFTKRGDIKGLKCVENYGTSYLIGHEKNAVFRIHCTEMCADDGSLSIEFLAGTELLHKEELPGNIYSCMFNSKGRRFCKYYIFEFVKSDGTLAPIENRQTALEVVVKSTQLQRLTISEQRLMDGSSETSPAGITGTAVFLGMGLLFGFFMMLGFMAIEALTCLFFGDFAQFPTLFFETPWWAVFLGCGVPFGAIMGLLSSISIKR